MSEFLNLFSYANHRRWLRVCLFIGKWLMRLLSASVEVILRRNFGRRYICMLIGSFIFTLFCFGLIHVEAFLSVLFLFIMFVRLTRNIIKIFRRIRLSIPEPHSSSTGESWIVWQRHGFSQTTVQRYLEPALCLIAGLIVLMPDKFLGRWLMASAVALFIKEQISRWKINRRIIDANDAKLEAQRLHASLAQVQQKPGHAAQKSHRAHFPRGGRNPQQP